MAQTLGSIGAQVDLTVRTGDSLGPFNAVLGELETGRAIDLTGATLAGVISKLDDPDGDIPMEVTVLDAAAGTLEYGLANTAALAGGTFFDAAATYSWKLTLTDSAGTKSTLLFGLVYVAAGVLT